MFRLVAFELRAGWRTWLGAFVVAGSAAFAVHLAVTYWWSVITAGVGGDAERATEVTALVPGAIALLVVTVGPAMIVLQVVLGIVSTQQRTAHALWRLAGALPEHVWRGFILQAVVITVPAAIIGVVASIPVLKPATTLVLTRLETYRGDDVVGDARPVTIVLSLVLVVTVGLLSAIVPAARASRVSPIQLVRDTAVEKKFGVARRIVAGLATALLLYMTVNALSAPSMEESDPSSVIADGAYYAVLAVTAFALWAPLTTPALLRGWTRVVPSIASVSWVLARHSTRARVNLSTATITPLMVAIGIFGTNLALSGTLRQMTAAGTHWPVVPDQLIALVPGALVAVIGSIATVFMVSRSRNTEIALLRTAGATNRDITLMLVFEAVIYSVTAAMLSIVPIALTLVVTGLSLTKYGLPLAFVIPLAVPAIVLAIGFLGNLTALLVTGAGPLRQSPRNVLTAQ